MFVFFHFFGDGPGVREAAHCAANALRDAGYPEIMTKPSFRIFVWRGLSLFILIHVASLAQEYTCQFILLQYVTFINNVNLQWILEDNIKNVS